MEFTITKEVPEKLSCDLIAIGCFEHTVPEGKKAPPAVLLKDDGGTAIDRALGGEISRMLRTAHFTGAVGKMRLIYTEGRLPARHVLLVGLGKAKEATVATLRTTAAKIVKVAEDIKATNAAFVLQPKILFGAKPAARLAALVEGFMLGRYSFEVYKAKAARQEKTLATIHVLMHGAHKELGDAIDMALATATATILARDMAHTPGNDMTPTILAKFAREAADKGGLTYEEHGPDWIVKEKMGAFAAIAQGSVEPPVFIHMRYTPKTKTRAHVALVGKGVTFDAGGISIKPSRGMEEMKDDMGGAAAVIGTMQAIAKLKPSVTVDAYIAATENMSDGKAIKPGDIVTARNGKTIEIISTDAEGRMILADGLTYAAEKKPDYMIDIATLTGTCPYAVGEKYSAVMGNNQKLVDKLIAAGESAGEPLWQLPLEKDYMKGLTSGIADLKNLGTSKADTIIGALFLSNFVADVPWAHLDIASTAWTNEPNDYTPKGPTGVGVRLLVQFLMNL